VLPIISAFTPLVILPSLSRALGSSGWSSLAVGYSIGSFSALIVNLAWNIDGPGRAAAASTEDRLRLFRTSVSSRSTVSFVMLPVAALLAYLTAPSLPGGAALMAAATALAGALPSWYFIALSRPGSLALFDTIPRFLAALAASLLLMVYRSEFVYPAILLITLLVSVVASCLWVTGQALILPTRDDIVILRKNAFLVLSTVIQSGYTSLAVLIVAIVSPTIVPLFAAVTRFRDFGVSGLVALTNALQGWVSEVPSERERHRRRRRGFMLNATAAFAVGAAVAIGLPVVDRWFFGEAVQVDYSSSSLAGVSIQLIGMSMAATYYVLAPRGRTNTVAASGILTTLIGVPLLIVLTQRGGAHGGLAAIALAETISLAVQLIAWGRMTRRDTQG